MSAKPPKPRFLEFFAGVGMARLGLGGRWSCAWANDLDPTKAQIYRHNYGAAHFDPRDVHDVAAAVCAGNVGGDPSAGAPAFPIDAQLAWASFPCQDLSLAGDRGGLSARRSGAYWPFWRIMRDLPSLSGGARPRIIVLENVVGLLSDRAGFERLCTSLGELGMRYGAMKLDARDFVPQSRPRVFIVAVSDTVDLQGLIGDRPIGVGGNQNAVVKAHAALSEAARRRWLWWQLPAASRPVPQFAAFFDPEADDVAWNSQTKTDYLLSLMTQRHRERVEAAMASGKQNFGFLYRRTRSGQQRAEVRFDGLAGCLRTARGGSSRQTLVVVEGPRVRTRLLSALESARLMGVQLDDGGRLPGAAESFFPPGLRGTQIVNAMGDGVAVPVVAHLEQHLLWPLLQRSSLPVAA